MKKRLEGFWFKLLFSLAFTSIGIAVLIFEVLPSYFEWRQMKSWPEVSAQLQEVKLITNPSDDSETYEATARYSYRYEGRDYSGHRVAIFSGSDNIGDFQWRLNAQLKSALRNQQSVTAWVNPNQPSEAVLNRDMRWGMLGFLLIFVVAFGGLGILFVVLCFISPASEPQASNDN